LQISIFETPWVKVGPSKPLGHGWDNMELGAKIRTLRRQRGMGLDEFSRRSGVSKSLISLIERNISVPTVRSLEKIVKALGISISSLYHEIENTGESAESQGKFLVVRKGERKKLLMGRERGGAHYELLTPDYQRKLQLVYMHFPAGKKSGRFISHEGEECGVVLEGILRVQLGDHEIILEDGDSISFPSTVPHLLENIGDIEVRAFWANTPPTF
jgi:transcriptional regulator with XRE-family HTH domain